MIFVGFGGSLNVEGVLDFVDSGHDLILAGDSNASDLIRNIAAECGVDFDEVRFPSVFLIILPCKILQFLSKYVEVH